jgi:predicted CXXCH cytochrome family protein
MPFLRTAKSLAGRINPRYFKRRGNLETLRIKLVITAAVAAAVWAAYLLVQGRHGALAAYNPGPVCRVHAMIQMECSKCHQGDGKSEFSRTVSDAACLHCHDGSIHHANQVEMVGGPVGHQRSANCTACHVEHRGEAALAAKDDATCLRCHTDLRKHDRNPPLASGFAGQVTAFDLDSHPAFGRLLPKNEHGLAPLAVVKFSHVSHAGYFKQHASQFDCNACHSTRDVNPLATTTPTLDQPVFAGSVPPVPSSWNGDQRYMRPISYEKNCRTCHVLYLKGNDGPSVPHVELDIVRLEVANLRQLYLDALAIDPKRNDKLAEIGPPPRRKKTVVPATQWADKQIKTLRITPPNGYLGPAAGSDPSSSDAMIAAWYMATAAPQNCLKCHGLRVGSQPAVVAVEDISKRFEALAAKDLSHVQTAATGIPGASPLRWYGHSSFDHYAHRDQSCARCHAQSVNSGKTDGLTLDMTMPKIESCVECHHPDRAAAMGAGTHCTECHSFHDRSKERLPPTIFTETDHAGT